MSIYTQKTLELLRRDGFRVAVVERWNSWTRTRHDLFGIIDILAISPLKTIGVQSTSRGAEGEHIKKVLASDGLADWLGDSVAAREFRLVTWGKQKIKRGGTAFRYSPRVIEFVIIERNGQKELKQRVV